jgi:N-acetylglucosaminyldiphosphoundecaprenol N-acetyl-beta-D-mannosaminyltransferase
VTERFQIFSLSIHHTGFDESLSYIIDLAAKKTPSYVCFANVHMTIEAYRNKLFSDKVNNAALVLPDGKPIASAFKLLHDKKQERISGMDITPALLKKANESHRSVFIYGSTIDVIDALKEKIRTDLPGIHFAGAISPPFRKPTGEETDADIQKINRSGADLVFVSLGCPKQEYWMAENSSKINAVLLGIGAALPVTAGIQKRAPKWMQNMALEWLYRLLQQPRRLFGRYLFTNSYFLFLLGRQWLKTIFKKNAFKSK